MTGVEVLERARERVVGGWRDVFIVAWREAPTTSAVMQLGTALRRFATGHERGVSVLVIVEPACPMPDAAARELMARDMKRHETFTRDMALVYEGDGFRAAALRSVVAGLQLLSRQVVPLKTVATVEQAAAWLAGRRRVERVAAADIVSAVGAIRAAVAPP